MRHSKEKKEAFPKALLATFGVAPAADAVGISRGTAYRWRETDAKFAQAWDEAIEGAIDDVEKALADRAKGKDTIAGIFLLKSRRRDLYHEKQTVELQSTGQPPVIGTTQTLSSIAAGLAVLSRAGALMLPDAVESAKDVTPRAATDAPKALPEAGQV